MKTAILATALATVSAIPKINKLVDHELGAVAKEARTHRLDNREVIRRAVADKVIDEKNLDKNGQLNTQSHYYDWYFEINAGRNGCSGADLQETFGIATGQCWNGVWPDDQSNNDHAYPESVMLFYPNNAGFPLFAVFDGHGCNWYDAFWYGRVPKNQFFGFPGTYSPWDGCHAFQDDAGNNVYHMEASWNMMGPNPAHEGALFTSSRSNKACHNGKIGTYEYMRANTCIAWEEDDGTMTSEKIIVNSCFETGTMDVDVKKYSDAICQNLVDTEKHTTPDVCMFDPMYFEDAIMYGDTAFFEYHNKTCFRPVVV